MKKLLKPEIEFVKFDAQDVITTSGDSKVNKSISNWDVSNPVKDDTEKSLTKAYSNLDWNINQ